MFFVDQVGVKAPGSPRRMTRRPLQRCAKFTALREKKNDSRAEQRGTLSDAVDAVDAADAEHQLEGASPDAGAALGSGKADVQVDRRRLIAERCKSAAAAEHRCAAQRCAGKHGRARVQLRAVAVRAILGTGFEANEKTVPSFCETVQRSFAAVVAGCSLHAGQRVPHALDAL